MATPALIIPAKGCIWNLAELMWLSADTPLCTSRGSSGPDAMHFSRLLIQKKCSLESLQRTVFMGADGVPRVLCESCYCCNFCILLAPSSTLHIVVVPRHILWGTHLHRRVWTFWHPLAVFKLHHFMLFVHFFHEALDMRVLNGNSSVKWWKKIVEGLRNCYQLDDFTLEIASVGIWWKR